MIQRWLLHLKDLYIIKKQTNGRGKNMRKDSIYYQMMSDEINTINDYNTREFALKLLDEIPEYFFTVPASSSGKYHPENDLGEGGLVRHSISVKRILDHLLVLEGYFTFTNKEKELLKVAALFHDCMKSGTQSDYVANEHTKFLHPIFASAFILVQAATVSFPYNDAMFIADAIASHMGQWHKSDRENGSLPTPVSDAQKILHLADYMSSRKDINMKLEKPEISIELKQ